MIYQVAQKMINYIIEGYDIGMESYANKIDKFP